MDILNGIDITKQDYQWAMSMSSDSDYVLHLKRPIDSCFMNNYFIAGLKGIWIIITSASHMFALTLQRMKLNVLKPSNAAKVAKQANLDVRDSLRIIGAAFLSTHEVSAREGIYRYMPELWLRKIFPKTLFVSMDFAEKPIRFVKSQQELDELDDDSTDIFKSNIIVRYSDRLKNIPIIDICLALFAARYFEDYKSDFKEVSDSQLEVLSDDY